MVRGDFKGDSGPPTVSNTEMTIVVPRGITGSSADAGMMDSEWDAWLDALQREAWWRAWGPFLLGIAVLYALLAVAWTWM